MKDEGNYLIDW